MAVEEWIVGPGEIAALVVEPFHIREQRRQVDLVATRSGVEVGDRVGVVVLVPLFAARRLKRVEDVGILPRAAGQRVPAAAIVRHVVEDVVSAAADRRNDARELVMAAAAVGRASGRKIDRDVARIVSVADGVAAAAAHDRVVAGTADQQIVAGAAADRIVAGAAVDRVVGGRSVKRVGARRSRNRFGASVREVR